MTTALLVIALVWLLALTVVLAGVVRHLGALQVANVLTTAPQGGFNFDTDGPWLNSPLPDRAAEAFRRAGVGAADFVAVFFSAGCGTCLERADGIAGTKPDPERIVFLIGGSHRPEPLADLRAVLEPVGAPILTDPDAHDIAKSLNIQSTPFAFRVVAGQVVGKVYVRTDADLATLTAENGHGTAGVDVTLVNPASAE
jgi:hypothetical protein